MELLVRRVGLLVCEQHQHARGRLASLRVQGSPDANAERLRAQERALEGEGRQSRGRGRPGGSGRGDLGQAPRTAVRRPDEDEAGQRLGSRSRRADGEREARRVPRGEWDRSEADHQQGTRCPKRASGGSQSAGANSSEERPRQHVAARQACRLLDQRPRVGGALPRGGELGRRLRNRRPRPHLPGDPARCAAR